MRVIEYQLPQQAEYGHDYNIEAQEMHPMIEISENDL